MKSREVHGNTHSPDNINDILDSLDIYLSVFELNPEDPTVIGELLPLFEQLKACIGKCKKKKVLINLTADTIHLLKSITDGTVVPNDFTVQLVVSTASSLRDALQTGKSSTDVVQDVVGYSAEVPGNESPIEAEQVENVDRQSDDIPEKGRDTEEIVNEEEIERVVTEESPEENDEDDFNDIENYDEDLLSSMETVETSTGMFELTGVSGKEKELFFNAGRQHYDTLMESLAGLEEGYDQDTVDAMIRAFLGLQGASSFIKHDELALLAGNHEESLVALADKQDSGAAFGEIRESIIQFTESLGNLLDNLKEALTEEGRVTPEILENPMLAFIGSDGPQQSESSRQNGEASAAALTTSRTMRISINKINDLMNAVEELLITNSSLLRIQEEMSHRGNDSFSVKTLSQIYGIFEKITEMMHNEMLSMRMSPVRSLFSTFKRVIEDLSVSQKKEIDVRISGEETQVDRLVLETLKDPLIHLVRNAVDHGVELPAEREKRGKRRRGSVSLRAFNDINSVVIEIEDDGKGIDCRKLSEKLVEKGLASRDEIQMITEREILDFIFQPGFSTAEQITDISGRGVGMDVVKTSLKAMGGTIDIDTKPGEGTCFIIRLPLAMTMADALVVKVEDETYSIPTDAVERIMKIPEKDFRSIYNRSVLPLPGRTLPYRYLSDILSGYGNGCGNGHVAEDARRLVLILKNGGEGAALGVDRIIGKQKVVIKNLGSFLKSLPGISGASIQGDGSVMLVLDGEALCERIR